MGVGVPISRRSFTFPQVNQLLELSAIIESAFERTLMAMKIQHSEQLATVGLLGASLAHEIRNPLVFGQGDRSIAADAVSGGRISGKNSSI